MNSTSTSENVLTIKNLTISFNLSRYRSKSIKDLFVEFASSPFRFLFNRPKKLDLLSNINFELKKGERVGLVGINGIGKTTLCRTISGMYGVKNEIKVNGKMRAIFDTASVVQPELSGKENAWMITNILYNHLSKKERADIVEESLDFAELDEHIYSPFKYYSKGMKVRLFLSIVSARPCDLLILDEVFNGADEFFNQKISTRITNVIKESGAVLFISHDRDIIRHVCNKVAVIGHKKILFEGGVEEGLDFYKEHFSGHIASEV